MIDASFTVAPKQRNTLKKSSISIKWSSYLFEIFGKKLSFRTPLKK